MTRLSIDFEHADRTWWEAGGEALWEALGVGSGEASIVLDDDIAASWLREAARLEGWANGPEHAPHPIATSALSEDEEDL